MFFFVSQSRINFIRHNENIFFYNYFCNRLQILLFHNCACRIVRIRQNQNFCFVCDCRKKFFRLKSESVFGFQINNNRFCTCKNSTGFIRNIRRLRDYDFITRVYNRTKADVNGFRAADSYKNFVFRIVFNILYSF